MQGNIYHPSEALSDFVMCYWTLESTKAETPLINTIVPDGTMKLIFHYGDSYEHHTKLGTVVSLPKSFLIGQLTEPYKVAPTGDSGIFMVRFHSHGFEPFTTRTIQEMENKAIPLEVLFGNDGNVLSENVLYAQNTQERIAIVEHFLLNRLKDSEVTDRVVNETIALINNYKGQKQVNELSELTQHHRRLLSRRFSSTVGLSPKQLSRIIRLQHLLKTLINNKEATKLTQVAYEHEYFDQAHFIKEFKAFTGQTPKAFYGEDFKMSLLFDRID